jgi:hypothetical protein
MLGCGGLYACILFAFAVGGAELRGNVAAWLAPLLVLALGAPHYGATLVRVYEHRNDRRSYVVFSVYATIAIVAFFAVSLFDWTAATWLVTIYLTWSPWHYTGQNYGLAVMFLRRRDVEISPAAKRLLYSSFILSYLLTFMVFHGDVGSSPTPEFASGPRTMFVSIGIPPPVMTFVFPALLALYLGSLVAAGVLLSRRNTLRDLAPSALLVLSQALWFAVPMALRYWRVPVEIEPFRWQLRDYYFFWIALGHSTQYLWITTYYARNSDDWRSYRRYLGKILVAGTAVWTLPAIALDPNFGADLPNTTALTLLVASAVNIHHFVLDGAIWKLRNSRIAAILIRSTSGAAAATVEAKREAPWARRAVWAVAVLGCTVAVFQYTHRDLLLPRAMERNDYAAARAILERFDWLVEVSDEGWAGLQAAEASYDAAMSGHDRRLERRLGVTGSADAAVAQAQELAARGEWSEALALYRKALERNPNDPALLRGASRASLQLGQPRLAVSLLERLVALRPRDAAARRSLDDARRRAEAASR